MTEASHGWIVTAGAPGITKVKRQFLVALTDSEEAIAAVQKVLKPGTETNLHMKVESFHLSRRGMKPGEVLELGANSAGVVRKQKARKK